VAAGRGFSELTAAAVRHALMTSSRRPHCTHQQRVEHYQQRQRQEREQRLIHVLVHHPVAGGLRQ